jgi:hypothetical protein
MINRRSLLLATVASVGLPSTTRAEDDPSHPTVAAPSAPAERPHPTPTTTELLMHATVRIECTNAKGDRSTGTGFFFTLFKQEDNAVVVIVSNKHVSKGAVTGSFQLTVTVTRR